MRVILRPRTLLAGASLLLSSLACGPEATGGPVSALASSSPAVQVLRGASPSPEGREPERGAKALSLRRAAESWRAAPGEASALGLARAYFPELADTQPLDDRYVPTEALQVRFPAAPGEPLELESWGHLFHIQPEALGAVRLAEGGAFASARHFFTPSGGRALTSDGRWKTPRVEEYVVLDAGEPSHRMRYTVKLPQEVVGARDTGEYLELLDTREVPVLRLHGIVARDAAGQERRGTVHLRGASLQQVPADGMARYALRGTLQVEMAVDLRGMTAPVVVDPGWSSTGSMADRRGEGHTLTLLPSGKVLVTGGHTGSNGVLYAAELYDPTWGTWASAGNMARQRQHHTATLLPSGKVLVTGGFSDPYALSQRAELYDPATGTWTPTENMASPRQYHAAVLLPSGKVLVLAGVNSDGPLRDVEEYDPATGVWTAKGILTSGRYAHTATLLNTGKVLVIGGVGNNVTGHPPELFNPATGSSASTGAPSPSAHTATLLKSGKVLIAGDRSSQDAWVYDPATGTSSLVPMPTAHFFHAAALLPSGRVVVTGGNTTSSTRTGATDVYNPVTGTWQAQGFMPQARSMHQSVGLPSGQVLVVGGTTGSFSAQATSVLYDSGERAPVAQSQSVTTASGTAVAVTLQATDANGEALTYQVLSGPTHGSLTGTPPNLTYVPAAGFIGQDAFTWKASDGSYESNLATVSLTVTQPNEAPVAQPLSATIAEDTPATLTLQATDANGDGLTYQVLSSPAHGSLTGTPPNLTYVPASNFVGQDSFTWTASDGTASSALMTVRLTVTQVNDVPVASAFTLTVAQDSSATPVTLSGVDPEGGTLSYTIVSWPLNGWLSGTPPHLTYTPTRGFSGRDSFSYRVSDGKLSSSPVTIPITVTLGGAESLRSSP